MSLPFVVGSRVVNFGNRAEVVSITLPGQPMPSGSGHVADATYVELRAIDGKPVRWLADPSKIALLEGVQP